MTENGGEERLGEVIGGRYHLRGILGRGGQSVIYRAKDQIDGDEVAIKIVKPGDPDAIERLYREAKALVSLAGTAAIRVLHQTHTPEGAACLVTEILRGRDLEEHLQELEDEGARMPLPEVLTTFEPIVRTLDVAHARGIVHRDIKPANVFLIHAAYGGGVRLIDFGFSRFVGAPPRTAPGMVAGSPTYLSPEAWTGSSNIDHRADVYAFGAMLFRVLGGVPPFRGSMHELIRVVRTAPRPSLHALRPDLPTTIDGWVECALAIDREQRFQNAAALWTAFRACLGPALH